MQYLEAAVVLHMQEAGIYGCRQIVVRLILADMD